MEPLPRDQLGLAVLRQDLDQLVAKCETLTSHFQAHGVIEWPRSATEALRHITTKTVVTAADYAVALGEISAALSAAKAIGGDDIAARVSELVACRERLASIVGPLLSLEAATDHVARVLEGLEWQAGMLGGQDDFQYELAANARSGLEYYFEALHSVLPAASERVRSGALPRLSVFDTVLKKALGELVGNAEGQRLLPPCPAYTPTGHWWYGSSGEVRNRE